MRESTHIGVRRRRGPPKGGDDVGGHARAAAAACLVFSGLLVGGAVTASADTAASAEDVAEHAVRPADDATEGRDPEGAEPGEGAEDDPEREPGRDPDLEGDPGAEVKPDGGDGLELPSAPGEPGAEDEAVQNPRPPCCDATDEDCQPGWPWPDDRPNSDHDYGESPSHGVPSIRPVPGGALRPGIEPPASKPERPDVLDVVSDVGVIVDLPEAPVSVPIVVTVPAVSVPARGGAPPPAPAAAGPGAETPAGPRRFAETPPRQQTPATTTGAGVTVPTSAYRVGYGDYLRGAGLSQIAALALPGLAGLLVLTGAGGLVGYRQARTGHAVRTGTTGRFMN